MVVVKQPTALPGYAQHLMSLTLHRGHWCALSLATVNIIVQIGPSSWPRPAAMVATITQGQGRPYRTTLQDQSNSRLVHIQSLHVT